MRYALFAQIQTEKEQLTPGAHMAVEGTPRLSVVRFLTELYCRVMFDVPIDLNFKIYIGANLCFTVIIVEQA